MDDLTTLNSERILAERNSLHSSYLPEGDSKTHQELLVRNYALKQQYLLAQEEKWILNEILKPPQEWNRTKYAEAQNNMSEEEQTLVDEMNKVSEERMAKVLKDIDSAEDIVQTWKTRLGVLYQKMVGMESKKSELESIGQNDDLVIHHMEIKCAVEKVNVLLAAAKAEWDILHDRRTRMELSLQDLYRAQASLKRVHADRSNQLKSLQQMLDSVQQLCGVKCHVVDANTLNISLQVVDPADLNVSEADTDKPHSLDECNFTATLKFMSDDHDGFVLSDVLTDKKMDEIDQLVSIVKQDKDLRKFILNLRNMWLSYLPLNTELACLRKRHAIDFIQEEGVLQLIINKRNIICTLNVPKSYPRADVTLIDIVGHPQLAAHNVQAPPTKTLTAWIKHLEDLLGQH